MQKRQAATTVGEDFFLHRQLLGRSCLEPEGLMGVHSFAVLEGAIYHSGDASEENLICLLPSRASALPQKIKSGAGSHEQHKTTMHCLQRAVETDHIHVLASARERYLCTAHTESSYHLPHWCHLTLH